MPSAAFRCSIKDLTHRFAAGNGLGGQSIRVDGISTYCGEFLCEPEGEVILQAGGRERKRFAPLGAVLMRAPDTRRSLPSESPGLRGRGFLSVPDVRQLY